jgi:uncharacterized protein (DUF1919 family)
MLKEKVRKVIVSYKMIGLKNKDFSIISNNCWGSQVYQDIGLKYSTPFVGLFLFAPCYIKLVKDPKFYLEQKLVFIDADTSMYKDKIDQSTKYPIALLHDVEVHFLHYENEQEASRKWYRRLERFNWNNFFIKFCDRDLCTDELLNEFDKIPIKNKICFTAKNHENLKCAVWFKEFEGKPYVDHEMSRYIKYFNLVKWLNNGIKTN